MKKIKPIIDWLKKDKKRLVGLAVLLILIFLAGQKIFGQKNNQTQIQTAKVERGTIVSSISASGQILSGNIVDISTSARGMVKTVYVKDGDTVTAGQKILEISLDTDGQQKAAGAYSVYFSAKNSLESAKASQYTLQSDMFSKWKTYKDLAESSSYDSPEERSLPQFYIAQNDWLAAEAKYKNQQNVVLQSQTSLNNAWQSYQLVSPTVTASISGTITNITYSPGMTISAATDTTSRVAVIKSEGNPLASFNISEIDVSKVKVGQKATVKLDSITDKTFTGKVMTVDKIGTVTSGVTNYPVVIQLDTQAAEILPNMSATANIILEAKDNALLVPSGAIQQQGNQSAVRVIKGKQQQTITVETGLISDTQTEIISGLSEGEEVVISTSIITNQTGRSVFSGLGGGQRMFMGR